MLAVQCLSVKNDPAANTLFSEKGHEEGDLDLVSTFDADINIRTIITELQDTKLVARIDRGGVIAKETK